MACTMARWLALCPPHLKWNKTETYLLQSSWNVLRKAFLADSRIVISKRMLSWILPVFSLQFYLLLLNYQILVKSPKICINRWVGCKNSFTLKSLFSLVIIFFVSIKVLLTANTIKPTWISCCPLEILRWSEATQFWGLMKITKHTLHLCYWERNKSR